MVVDEKDFGIREIWAFYIYRKNSSDRYIEISSKNNDYRIVFSFNNNDFSPKSMKKNQTINLINYINWDVELENNDSYYLFDISKEKVLMTKLDNNLFNILVKIENPDMIYSSLGEEATFNSLSIDTNFSFIYNEVKEM